MYLIDLYFQYPIINMVSFLSMFFKKIKPYIIPNDKNIEICVYSICCCNKDSVRDKSHFKFILSKLACYIVRLFELIK